MNTEKRLNLMACIFDYKSCKYLLIQAFIVLCAYFVLFSIFYYFTGVFYIQVNQSDGYFNRTLQVEITTIKKISEAQILNDVISMSEVEDAYYTNGEGKEDILNILLKDFRNRNDVLYSLPSYFDKIGVFTHQIEADRSKLVFFRNSGAIALGILVLVVMLFMRHFSKKVIRALSSNMKLLYILGYSGGLLWRLWIIPAILVLCVSLIGALIIQFMLVVPFIETIFHEISFLDHYGLRYDFNLKGIGYAYILGIFSTLFWIKNSIAKEIQNSSLL